MDPEIIAMLVFIGATAYALGVMFNLKRMS